MSVKMHVVIELFVFQPKYDETAVVHNLRPLVLVLLRKFY